MRTFRAMDVKEHMMFMIFFRRIYFGQGSQVTGGAGYIGSHAVKALGEIGYTVLVFDNLSNGHRDAVLHGDLIVGDLANTVLLDTTIKEFQPEAVMHFASFIEVGESVREQLLILPK